MTRIDDLEADLAALRARSLSSAVALRKCEPFEEPEPFKKRAREVYAMAVLHSGGDTVVAKEEGVHHTTVRYRRELPTRNVHLEHVCGLPPEGISLVVADLQALIDEKIRRLRRAG